MSVPSVTQKAISHLLIFHGFEPAQVAHARAVLDPACELLDASATTLSPDVIETCTAAFFQIRDSADSAIQAARRLYKNIPSVSLVLCSPLAVTDYLELAFENGINHVMNTAGNHWATRLPGYCKALISEPRKWNARLVLAEPCRFHNLPFDTNTDRQLQLDAVLSFFQQAGYGAEPTACIRIALDELLNNALYHGLQKDAPQTPSSEDMETSDHITIEFGLDENNALISVTDTAGRLNGDRIKETLIRQIKQQGTYDPRGRGLFLMRSLSDEMYFHLFPGRRTQVTLLFGRHHNPLVKNLQINTGQGLSASG